MTDFSRSLRVAELLKPILADLIRNKVRDPRVPVQNIVISDIEVSTDLSHAKVYMRTIGDEDCTVAAQQLDEMAGFLRCRVGAAVRLKKIPALHFCADKTLDIGNRLEQLLAQIR